MNAFQYAVMGGFRAEATQLIRARLFIALTVILAVTFLLLVSLFGLTGSRAPTAVVSQDKGALAQEFIGTLAAAHHSFALRPMSAAAAAAALRRGEIVAVITIPPDFSRSIADGTGASVNVAVDNVDTDMTDDIQRALPSAVVAFGQRLHLPGIRVRVDETDLIGHDTGFIPYLVVSGLALDAFVIAGILSATMAAREFETGTVHILSVSPVSALAPLFGRALAAWCAAAGAMVFPVAAVVAGYRVLPLHPAAAAAGLLLCVAAFGSIGVGLGALLKRTLPVASLVLGTSLPLYVCSGSLEPERFDGPRLWVLAHFSPVYYAVGVLEAAFHGLQVTPEPVWLDFVGLAAWALLLLSLAWLTLRRRLT